MVYYGPEKLKKICEIDLPDEEYLIEFLYNYKEKLDVFHKHLILISIYLQNNFTLVVGSNPENKVIYGVTISNPFERTPSLYKIKDYYNEELANFYNTIFESSKIPKVQAGILRFPIQTHFLAVGGDKTLVSKEMFNEEVTGKPWLNFAKKVDNKMYEKIIELSNGHIDFLRSFVTDDGVYFVGLNDGDFRNLYAEFFSFLRNKYKFSPGKFFPISGVKEKVIGMFKIELEDINNAQIFDKINMFIEDFSKFKVFLRDIGGIV
ncbi:DUF4895 domain-containing protein [Thermosipho atlanticus]|uniref:Uncharacterized protein n=1 Tax=Thermosipho atlanticus DSM 15807 TaxID=1123380 RepID=A0A1M5RTT7_9BACT|nr:DUF4895 domain-containing protein [Thermosipho atlanticus]SHH29561.1 protein of unknown function [Thermosipho atlanticus DSM 15807]